MPTVLDEFWTRAVRECFVSTEKAEAAALTSQRQGWPPEQTASECGALTAAQVEIVKALLRPHDLVPGYELISHLGHGGMGVVYRASQLAFDRIVALKTILVGPGVNAATLARFEQEAMTIGRLVHPHLVTAYDFSRHGGRYTLAMEFLDGEDAHQWRKHLAAPSELVVWGLIRQAASGLAHAAASGVIHRDIKPSNLLLVEPPTGFSLPAGVPLLKIADFGLALLQDADENTTRLTRENATVGSPQFMAPEQLKGSRVDHRADIYALGATAYHMFTGSAPFAGLTLSQLYGQKLHGDPPAITEVRPDLSPLSVSLIAWLMTREAEQRPGSYTDILKRIDVVLANATATQPLTLRPVTGNDAVPTQFSMNAYENTAAMPVVNDQGELGQAAPPVVDAPRTLDIHDVTQRMAAATLPSPNTATPTLRKSRLMWAVSALLLVGLVVAGFWGSRQNQSPDVPRTWKPTKWATACYNGKSLKGWQIVSGNWIPGQDDGEHGAVLSGSDGVLGFRLVRPAGAKQLVLSGYQVIFVVNRHTAHAAELQFGVSSATQDIAVAARQVVRIEADQVLLGSRAANHGPLQELVATRPLTAATTQHEIRLEKHELGWCVLVDDEPLGVIPASQQPVRPEFFLASESNPGQPGLAWFSDIVLEELGPVQP